MVVCCLCGVTIDPNDAMMCLPCLRLEVNRENSGNLDAVEREVLRCPKCLKWKRDSVSSAYFAADLESLELLTHLSKRVRRLKDLMVVDAKFIWTEPHSKRIRVQVVYEQMVLDRTKVKQSVELEFRIRDRLCKGCAKLSDKFGWESIVQIRQQSASVDVLLRLEKDLRDSDAHRNAMQIGSSASGLDLTFAEDKHANEFVRFVRNQVPCSYTLTRKVVSTDVRSGMHNIKYTHLLTVAPINTHDLVILPVKLANAIGGVGRVALCLEVTNQLTLLDICNPTRQPFIVTAQQYFRHPFRSVLTVKQLTSFMVLDFQTHYNAATGYRGRMEVRKNSGGRSKSIHSQEQVTSMNHVSKKNKKKQRRRKAAMLRAAAVAEKSGVHAITKPTVSVDKSKDAQKAHIAEVMTAITITDAEVVKETDLGENDQTKHITTHIGHLLEVGELIYGYDLDGAVGALRDDLGSRGGTLPSVVLVKGEEVPDPKKRKNRAYRGKKENFNGGRPLVAKNTEAQDMD